MLTREQAAAMDTDWRDRREARVVEAIEFALLKSTEPAISAREIARLAIRAYERPEIGTFTIPAPLADPGCPTCGMNFTGGMGYVCPNAKCPVQARAT